MEPGQNTRTVKDQVLEHRYPGGAIAANGLCHQKSSQESTNKLVPEGRLRLCLVGFVENGGRAMSETADLAHSHGTHHMVSASTWGGQ